MNQASYEALPQDLRAVIDQNSGMTLARQAGLVWREAEEKSIATARKHGNVINVLDDEARQAAQNALEEVLVRWSESVGQHGIDGPKLIDQARQAISRYQE